MSIKTNAGNIDRMLLLLRMLATAIVVLDAMIERLAAAANRKVFMAERMLLLLRILMLLLEE